jgi:outer membrane protein assembly factor BamB
MRSRSWLAVFAVCLSVAMAGCRERPRAAAEGEPVTVEPGDWPWWRGPDRNGVASPDQKPPVRWSETENVVWKAPVPGRGHGSPTVVGNQVFLAAAESDREVQSVLCFDRTTGKQVWQAEVHKGGFDTKGNAKTSQASATVACDGKRLFINFLNSGAIYTTALDRDGKQLWQTRVRDFVTHQGFGSSPAVYQSLVLVSADHKGGGLIAGLDRATGKVIWSVDRPKVPNYASPIVLPVGGRDQLIMTGCDLVTGLDPLTGNKLWETKGSTTECVTSAVTDGTHVFTSGGYPKNHVSAVKADESAKVVWENGIRVYVPSLLVKDGYLYGVQDGGVATCWKCDTGKQVWAGRLGGTFSSSPVLVGDRIYATNEAGKTFIFKASPDRLEVEAENQLGDEVFATPTICAGRIYHRVATTKDKKRQEWLYCLGEK